MTVDEAITAFREVGVIARLSPLGRRLVLYEGEEARPGTWMMVGVVAVDRNGTIPALRVESTIRNLNT